MGPGKSCHVDGLQLDRVAHPCRFFSDKNPLRRGCRAAEAVIHLRDDEIAITRAVKEMEEGHGIASPRNGGEISVPGWPFCPHRFRLGLI